MMFRGDPALVRRNLQIERRLNSIEDRITDVSSQRSPRRHAPEGGPPFGSNQGARTTQGHIRTRADLPFPARETTRVIARVDHPSLGQMSLTAHSPYSGFRVESRPERFRTA